MLWSLGNINLLFQVTTPLMSNNSSPLPPSEYEDAENHIQEPMILLPFRVDRTSKEVLMIEGMDDGDLLR